MSRVLLKNDVTFCREDGSKVTFHIEKKIGSGASCVVYHAVCDDNTEHLLKEYYPRNLNLERNSDGALIVPEHQKESFDTGLSRFREGNEKQKEVRLSEKLKNFTSNVQGYFYGNGTEYIDMTVFSGRTYDKVENESLHTLLLRMRTLAQVIGYYHDAGLLHLDIKPENIFIRPEGETPEDVILFDFDSVLEKKHIALAHSLSYTKDWAAPEQLLPYKRRSICEATDLFSIGEIIFTKIFGRHSTQAERRSFAEYEIDYNADVFKNVNPKVVHLIKELFKHTICSVVKNRYQTTEELIEMLDEIIKFADPKKPFLQTTHLSEKFFVGRDEELVQIENELQNTKKLYISGMGGIGKSELVEQYAKNHKSEYDAIIIATYTTDIKSMICNIPIVNVADQLPNETQDEYLNRKVSALQNIGEENKLFLIIDNYNTEFNSKDDLELFDKLTACAHKTVITTRNNIFDERVINIKPIENARAIFDNYYKKPLSDNDSQIVDRIIAIYQNHTLATELLAKQMAAGRINPKDMLEKLNNGGLKNSGFEKIRVGNSKEHNAYSYIHTLFDISELSEDERYILLNLSLIPPTGISTEIFYKWCELSTYNNINSLVASGWINHDEVYDIISLHPVVADIMFDELEKDVNNCKKFITSINNIITTEEFDKFNNQFRNILFCVANSICEKFNRYEWYPDFIIDFIDTTAQSFRSFGNINKYIQYVDKAIKIHKNNYSAKNEITAMLYNTIGLLYMDEDILDLSEKFIKESLYISRRLFGENNAEVATSYCNLGIIYNNKNKFKQAKGYHKKSLRIREILFGRYSDDVANSYNCLASVCFDLGEFDYALELLNNALNIYKNLYGECHPDVALVHDNLGVFYSDMCDYANAKKHIAAALNIRLMLFGEGHSDVASSYNSLGLIYSFLEDYKKSEFNYKQALKEYKYLNLNNHHEVAEVNNNLAKLYYDYGFYDKAGEYYHKALQISKNIYGEEHSFTATLYDNIGMLYEKKEEYNVATNCLETALKIRHLIFGKNHPDVACSYVNLGSIAYSTKQYGVAKKYFISALNIFKHFYEEHTNIGIVYNNLAILYNDLGNKRKAKRYITKSIKIKSSVFGSESDEVIHSKNLFNNMFSK